MKRRLIASYYSSSLHGLPIQTPAKRENAKEVFHLYVIQIENRQGLISHLEKYDIGVGIHYPVPIHLQPAYKGRLTTAVMDVTEKVANKVLSLPIYPELSLDNAGKIVFAIKEYVK